MSIVAFDNRLNCINESKTSEMTRLYEVIDSYGKLSVDLYFSLPLWKYIRTPKWVKFEEAADFIYS